jgi:ABC-2 type transport system ATP-binding protein
MGAATAPPEGAMSGSGSAITSALLDVARVSKCFGRREVLSLVSFKVDEGEIVGLVGPNGAGKSTAFRIIAGLLTSDGGTVTIAGHDVQKDARPYRAMIGALIEAPGFYPGLSAFDHLAYLSRLRGRFSRDRITETLEHVGLAPRSTKPVGKFSLGMKQRLGIAMAILHQPRLLILDEPMNGLDPVGTASLRTFLRGMGPRSGVSVLVSSHLLHEVEQTCDRVLFIRDGRLLEEATLSRRALGEIETVTVRTGDDARAGALLRQEDFVRDVVETKVGLECRLDEHHVPRLAPLLVAAGLPVWQITPRRRTLEDLYLSRYGEAPKGGIE